VTGTHTASLLPAFYTGFLTGWAGLSRLGQGCYANYAIWLSCLVWKSVCLIRADIEAIGRSHIESIERPLSTCFHNYKKDVNAFSFTLRKD
jgi:hypothetical protein